MPTSTIASLLQAAVLLLTGVQGGLAAHRMAPSIAQTSVNIAGNAVQLATQAMEPVGFAVVPNDSRWPTIRALLNAPYRDANGRWVRLAGTGVSASTVQLVEGDTSFGDLNHDGRDDAAVVVKKQAANNTSNYFLAAMLNQGGIMFDIAEVPLGSSFAPVTATHTIQNGEAILNGAHYRLIGNQLKRY